MCGIARSFDPSVYLAVSRLDGDLFSDFMLFHERSRGFAGPGTYRLEGFHKASVEAVKTMVDTGQLALAPAFAHIHA